LDGRCYDRLDGRRQRAGDGDADRAAGVRFDRLVRRSCSCSRGAVAAADSELDLGAANIPVFDGRSAARAEPALRRALQRRVQGLDDFDVQVLPLAPDRCAG
jgi:hypothetical protein